MTLEYLLKLTTKELKKELFLFLNKKEMNPISEDGFIYAKGNIPILLVAHMDTVFPEPPKKILYNKEQDKIYNPKGGLGGDDRCGIYAILKLLKEYRPHILFTEDEEIGCIGASKAVKKLQIPNVKYIIEFDRRGKEDCVFYDCGNEEFINYIQTFDFILNYGSYSDISVLGSAWNIAAVNLSVGYYNEHTENEYVIFDELQKTINRAKVMLEQLNKAPYFEYQEVKYKPKHMSLFDGLSDEESLILLQNLYIKKEEQKDTKKLTLKNDSNNTKRDEKNDIK